MAEAADAPLVLVTGASGYISTHLIKQLLTQGKYRVRGTVRSLKNEDKVKELKGLVPDATYPLELFETDLNDDKGWNEAVQGCTFVCHVASPVPIHSPRDENEVINPAVNGTVRVLKACAETGTVKRAVVTSSTVAIGSSDDSHQYTEKDWAPEKDSMGYVKSKVLAEKAAWEFIENLEEEKKFELAVVNPGFVIGPLLIKTNTGSVEMVKAILNKDTPVLPNLTFPAIDVRDVAAAHIAAMEKPEAVGKRHIVSAREILVKDMAGIISREFTPQGYSIPLMTLPNFLAWPMQFFSRDIKSVYPMMGKKPSFNNERMRTVLGIEPRDIAVSLIETCYSLIEGGFVPKKQGYLGPAESRKPKEDPPPKEGEGQSLEKPATEETTESSNQAEKTAADETTESGNQAEKPATEETTESRDQEEKPATEETTKSSNQAEKTAAEETTESRDQEEKPATEETTESSNQAEKTVAEETTESRDQEEKPATEETRQPG